MTASEFENREPVDELHYAILDALRGDDDDYSGQLDHPCPLCGPGRSTEYNQTRPVLSTWRLSPTVISYNCARCEVKGSARFDTAQMLSQPPLPRMPRKPARSADLFYVERLWREASATLPPKATAYFRWRGIPIQRPLRPEKNCTRRRNELIAKGAMNTGEYGLEYPKLAEVRTLIVGWSSVHRCPIGCVMLQSLPTHAGWLHAVTQFLRECASAQSH